MKIILVIHGLITLAIASNQNQFIKTKTVDAEFITRQKKILSLLLDNNEYYNIGKDYDIEVNINNYTNKTAVEQFLTLYKSGFVPRNQYFSIYYENILDEIIALFRVFYYAKDFETFYKTAAFAKVHLNPAQFFYTYYTAVFQRPDTQGVALPLLSELENTLFVNWDVMARVFRLITDKEHEMTNMAEYFVVKEYDQYVIYSNYSDTMTYPNEEVRIAYLTEDVGWNIFYVMFNVRMPFWWNSEKHGEFKERRGEIYFYFYRQLLARYYLERLTNGMGEIQEFSWYTPFKTGYAPPLTSLPLGLYAQRSNNYNMHTETNFEYIRFLDSYEKTFQQYLQNDHFKKFDTQEALNVIADYWQSTAEVDIDNSVQKCQYTYEAIARRVLGAAPEVMNRYTFRPSALDSLLTTLRDPAFYQMYQRIVNFIIDFKKDLQPYTEEQLHFKGLKINEVNVDKLITYFEHYDYNITNSVFFAGIDTTSLPYSFVARQPRLNNEPFIVNINITSEINTDAIFKIFIGPKYNSNGLPISLENDWMKFYELDWFQYTLSVGENKVIRESNDFMFFKDDSVTVREIYKLLDEGRVPYDMSVLPDNMPRRLMLPRGTLGGYPLQILVFVYQFNGINQEKKLYKNYVPDSKSYGFPLDRPVREYFNLRNMFIKDVRVYQKGELLPYKLNTPTYIRKKIN